MCCLYKTHKTPVVIHERGDSESCIYSTAVKTLYLTTECDIKASYCEMN